MESAGPEAPSEEILRTKSLTFTLFFFLGNPIYRAKVTTYVTRTTGCYFQQ